MATGGLCNCILFFIVAVNAFGDVANAWIHESKHITTHIGEEKPAAGGVKPQAAVNPATGGAGPKPAAAGASGGSIDITKFGPLTGDINSALMSAWKEVCPTGGKIVIPKGDFLLTPVKFQGPCKGPVEFELAGNVLAPPEIADFKNSDTWVKFAYVDGLTIRGLGEGGVFDGRGQNFWKANDCNKNSKCNLPYNFRFDFVNGLLMTGVTSKDAPTFNINLFACKNATLQDMKINCPNDTIAPNTDGIHLSHVEDTKVIGVEIKTGDDCVSIGDGTKNLLIENVTCGPGHGISVGSIGGSKDQEPVTDVVVKNCEFTNTQNGVRIKTWLNSFPAVVNGMHFEGIKVNNVTYPIVLDQAYCPYNHCKQKLPSKVKVSNVTFKDITGTSSTPSTMRLICSSTTPCEGIQLSNIDIKYTGKEGPGFSDCANIKPLTSGPINPPVCSKIVPEFTVSN